VDLVQVDPVGSEPRKLFSISLRSTGAVFQFVRVVAHLPWTFIRRTTLSRRPRAPCPRSPRIAARVHVGGVDELIPASSARMIRIDSS